MRFGNMDDGGGRRALKAVAAVGCALAAVGVVAPGASADEVGPSCSEGTCTVTFNATGDKLQSFTVPSYVTSVQAQVAGAQGGAFESDPPAEGGITDATLAVTTPGETLTLLVGDQGNCYPAYPGGYGGGGYNGYNTGCAGGGGSFVATGSTLLLAAGGGGGIGGYREQPGDGAGAGQYAGDGGYQLFDGGGASPYGPGTNDYDSSADGGGPATASPSGISPGPGGNGVDAGGGGGGGYYGGAGGAVKGSAGGGSGYADPDVASNVSGTEGGNSAPGSVVFTYPAPVDMTSTHLDCGSMAEPVGTELTCTATVTDLTNPSITPTGTVAFYSNGRGAFDTTMCTLAGGSCSVGYTPAAPGQQTITAEIADSYQFAPSYGQATVTTLMVPMMSVNCASVTAKQQARLQAGKSISIRCITRVSSPQSGTSPHQQLAPTGTVSFTADPANDNGERFSHPLCTLVAASKSTDKCHTFLVTSTMDDYQITASYSGDQTYGPATAQTTTNTQ